MTVVLTARSGETARARAAELAARGLDVHGDELDVASDASVERFRARVADRWGRLDVLVNNAAGVSQFGEQPSSANLAQAHATLESTLFGAWRTTQALLPLLRTSAHPRIVNVSSGAGSHGDPAFGLSSANAMGPAYGIAKAALNALTSTFANELAGTNVIVNAVCPGFTATFPGGAEMGARPVHEGAAGIVWAALLPDSGPRGGLFRDGTPLEW